MLICITGNLVCICENLDYKRYGSNMYTCVPQSGSLHYRLHYSCKLNPMMIHFSRTLQKKSFKYRKLAKIARIVHRVPVFLLS